MVTSNDSWGRVCWRWGGENRGDFVGFLQVVPSCQAIVAIRYLHHSLSQQSKTVSFPILIRLTLKYSIVQGRFAKMTKTLDNSYQSLMQNRSSAMAVGGWECEYAHCPQTHWHGRSWPEEDRWGKPMWFVGLRDWMYTRRELCNKA